MGGIMKKTEIKPRIIQSSENVVLSEMTRTVEATGEAKLNPMIEGEVEIETEIITLDIEVKKW